jgi:hypothetical protein
MEKFVGFGCCKLFAHQCGRALEYRIELSCEMLRGWQN